MINFFKKNHIYTRNLNIFFNYNNNTNINIVIYYINNININIILSLV